MLTTPQHRWADTERSERFSGTWGLGPTHEVAQLSSRTASTTRRLRLVSGVVASRHDITGGDGKPRQIKCDYRSVSIFDGGLRNFVTACRTVCSLTLNFAAISRNASSDRLLSKMPFSYRSERMRSRAPLVAYLGLPRPRFTVSCAPRWIR